MTTLNPTIEATPEATDETKPVDPVNILALIQRAATGVAILTTDAAPKVTIAGRIITWEKSGNENAVEDALEKALQAAEQLIGDAMRTAMALESTGGATPDSAVEAAQPAEQPAGDDLAHIQPGMIYYNDAYTGPAIIVARAGERLTILTNVGMATAYVTESTSEFPEEGSALAMLAPHITSLFPLHPETAPFAPAPKYRRLPVLDTPEGREFIKTIMGLTNYADDPDLSPADVEEAVGELKKHADEGQDALGRLRSLIAAATGKEPEWDWDHVLHHVQELISEHGKLLAKSREPKFKTAKDFTDGSSVQQAIDFMPTAQQKALMRDGFILRSGLHELLGWTPDRKTEDASAFRIVEELRMIVQSDKDGEKLCIRLRDELQQIENARATVTPKDTLLAERRADGPHLPALVAADYKELGELRKAKAAATR